MIHNEEVCGELAIFYCNDPEYLGYYLEDDVDGQIASGSHIDNSTEYCLEPIDSYCSDSTYFEYYVDYSVSFDPYIGNIKDDSERSRIIQVVWTRRCLITLIQQMLIKYQLMID